MEALIGEVSTPRRARGVLRGRVRRGELLPGFGHPLYREGDPRAEALLETARKVGARGSSLGRVLAVADAAEDLGMERPTLDLGLVAVAAALGLPPGSSAILFCLGRTAGWTAHIQEQRASGVLLRPRARYVGHLGGSTPVAEAQDPER